MAKIITEMPFIKTIGEKVAFLKQSNAYPDGLSKVEVKETHMSWVFLVNGLVYKLKKPVKYRFLDFSILEARFRNCREEVHLNRRLAKDIYLGIVPLTVDNKGSLSLEGNGLIVDWLVKMKRIPEESMLDYAIKHESVNKMQVQQAATLLTEFYKSSPAIDINNVQYREKLKGEVQSIYRELLNPLFKLPVEVIERLTAALLHYLGQHIPVFDKRIKEGKIIEAHGDLRPEHICLASVPAIIDCLEFNRELRILDTAEELSFLAMECEIEGNKRVGELFFNTYTSLSNDNIPRALICFYKLKRAFLRSFLVIRHITEPEYKNDPKWLKKTLAYVQLAEQYETEMNSMA